MRFLLFLILSIGVNVGLYYAGLAYEEQSEEFTDFQKICVPKQVQQDALKKEVEDLQARLANIDVQYVEKLSKVAVQLAQTSSLKKDEIFALSLLKKGDFDSRTQAIKQRMEEIDVQTNLARAQSEKSIQKNEEAIINNNTRVDTTIIAARNNLGRQYSEHPNLAKELAARNALESKMNQLKKMADDKNVQIQQNILNIKKRFEELEKNAIDEKAALDQIMTHLSESGDDQQNLLSTGYYQKLLSRNPSFAALSENYAKITKKLTDQRNSKHEELQKLVTEVENHPYSVLRKNSVRGIRSSVIMILIGIDALIITFFYVLFFRRNA